VKRIQVKREEEEGEETRKRKKTVREKREREGRELHPYIFKPFLIFSSEVNTPISFKVLYLV
jgi:hypothetical protein